MRKTMKSPGEKVVIAYSKDYVGLISIGKTLAKKQGLEIIEEYLEGPGYCCPSCGRDTLTFTFNGLLWD